VMTEVVGLELIPIIGPYGTGARLSLAP